MSFDWKTLIPVFETIGNIAEMAIPGGAAFVPLTTAAEGALNPILLKIGSGQAQTAADVTQEVMSFYGTAIASLNLAKSKITDATLLSRIEEYLTAANAAAAAYLAAGQGLSASEFAPVTPITIPPAPAP